MLPRARVLIAALAVAASWVLNASSTTTSARWLVPISATVAFVMLLWAEIDRYDVKVKAARSGEQLRDRLTLLSDLGGNAKPGWSPGWGMLGSSIQFYFRALRDHAGTDWRILVEDPSGKTTAADISYVEMREGSNVQAVYPDSFEETGPPAEGIYRVMLLRLDSAYPGEHSECVAAFRVKIRATP